MRREQIVTVRAYESIVAQIEQAINDGALQVGSALPTEREMARDFGVSRTVIREAMRHLQARGIVEVRQGSGSYVRGIPDSTLSESLILLLKLDKASVLELSAVRQTLEILAVSLAAQHAMIDEIAAMRRCHQEMRDLAREGMDTEKQFLLFIQKNVEFHRLIGKASHNSSLSTILDVILPLTMKGRFAFIKRTGMLARFMELTVKDIVREDGHGNILNAIASHDSKAAEHFVFMHELEAMANIHELERLANGGVIS